jgi:hypothetical protein
MLPIHLVGDIERRRVIFSSVSEPTMLGDFEGQSLRFEWRDRRAGD